MKCPNCLHQAKGIDNLADHLRVCRAPRGLLEPGASRPPFLDPLATLVERDDRTCVWCNRESETMKAHIAHNVMCPKRLAELLHRTKLKRDRLAKRLKPQLEELAEIEREIRDLEEQRRSA